MKKKIIIVAVIIIALLGVRIFYWYLWPRHQVSVVATSSVVVPSATSTTPLITYYCQEGNFQAQYESSQVDFVLPNGQKFYLPQTVSGSGIRYEKDKMIFLSKGDNASLENNSKAIYTNCVSGNQVANQENNIYTNAAGTFSFSYPSQFVMHGSDFGYSQDWRAESSALGLLFNVVEIPREFLPQTNFGGAKFTIGVSADSDAVKNCLLPDQGASTTSQEMIGGRQFAKINLADAGAGNYYETTSYRTLEDGECYAVEYTIHSTNIENYSPDQGIKKFDHDKVAAILEGIARSFRFIK